MKRSRPRRVSARRRDEFAVRAEVSALARARDARRGGCQASALSLRHVAAVQCSTEVMHELDTHEVIPRSAWAGGWLALDNVLMVCRAHHRWIDEHPAEARALGLHAESWEWASVEQRARAADELYAAAVPGWDE